MDTSVHSVMIASYILVLGSNVTVSSRVDHADSAQATRWVDRAFGTWQDKMVREVCLARWVCGDLPPESRSPRPSGHCTNHSQFTKYHKQPPFAVRPASHLHDDWKIGGGHQLLKRSALTLFEYARRSHTAGHTMIT
jgi:hypothetical protein